MGNMESIPQAAAAVAAAATLTEVFKRHANSMAYLVTSGAQH